MYTRIHVCLYVCMYVYMYVSTYVCLYAYMYAYMHTCIHVFHTYIHTYIYTYSLLDTRVKEVHKNDVLDGTKETLMHIIVPLMYIWVRLIHPKFLQTVTQAVCVSMVMTLTLYTA